MEGRKRAFGDKEGAVARYYRVVAVSFLFCIFSRTAKMMLRCG